MNLLMIAPLRDSRGTLRYFLGAQVDVSGLAKDSSQFEALSRILQRRHDNEEEPGEQKKDEFQELSEMLNLAELDIVRRHGGKMHREHVDESDDASWHRPRLMLQDRAAGSGSPDAALERAAVHGKLSGVYQNVSGSKIVSQWLKAYDAFSTCLSDLILLSVSFSLLPLFVFLVCCNRRS